MRDITVGEYQFKIRPFGAKDATYIFGDVASIILPILGTVSVASDDKDAVNMEMFDGIPNVAGSTAYTSNWVAELFGPSNLMKKSTSGFPQRLYNSVLQGALGIDKDGIFGANTEKTVKEFQSAHGLTADGIAGAKTKAALAKQL